jgi:hypothetical protein
MNIEVEKNTEIFLSVLFYYFIKRKYSDTEFDIHKKRFYDIHKQDYNNIKNEFDGCLEKKINFRNKYEEFINISSITDKNVLLSYIYFFLYCKDDILYDTQTIEECFEYIQNTNTKYLSLLDDYLIKKKYEFKDNNLFQITEKIENIIKIVKPVYFIKYDAHSGHVFAYFIEFIKEYEGIDYVIAITEDYNKKHNHIIELYKLYRGNDKIVYLRNNNYYEMQINEIIPKFNYLYPEQYLFETKLFLFVKEIYFKKKTINDINIIESIADSSTINYSCHIDIINDCIKKCNDKHKNISFHKNIFIVKNNKKTPFNNTPTRGFSIDGILQNNFIKIDPQEIEFSLLVYFLNNAENIITSWNTIVYINKFFFNKKSKVLVLCHTDYSFEYNFLNFKSNIYFVDCKELFYIQDLDSNSINEIFLNKIINIFN